MRTIIYTDDDSVIDLGESFKRRIRIGQTVKVNGEPFHVWYIEETATLRNVRAERV